ncbi:hypothetical protein AVEN_139245-1 [Araneus ventricosus]|uniref:Uncharacterized protein n=1 Tax=Araneus ventricosus TaxID=182803 RepID=A0A4Y2PUU6_ARAVE|nr:hypothetical protein AVEN_139245-1 [Araneus ventricosus]
MDSVLSRGFVVQNTVTPLDLKESKNQSPILFISEEKQYVTALKKNRFLINKNVVKSPSVVYWEYYDEDRQIFEENIFKIFERKMFQERTDLSRIQRYLNVCRLMCRCVDLDESKRIFFQVSAEIESFDISLMLELLETVCLTVDMVLFIFNTAGMRNLDFLNYLLLLSKTRNRKNFQSLSLYSWDSITDLNIISHYFFNGHYSSISTLLKHGLQWKFCESVYVEYCKEMNLNW